MADAMVQEPGQSETIRPKSAASYRKHASLPRPNSCQWYHPSGMLEPSSHSAVLFLPADMQHTPCLCSFSILERYKLSLWSQNYNRDTYCIVRQCREWTMQCHAIVLDTTGRTYARKQAPDVRHPTMPTKFDISFNFDHS